MQKSINSRYTRELAEESNIADIREAASFWQAIRHEVKLRADFEPIMSTFFHATVLNHDTFEGALSFLLASKLDSPVVSSMAIREIFEGQRVLLVDDSIVRGSTMRRIVRLVRSLKPAELHLASFAPPVKNPCYYGIDTPNREQLIAARYTPEETARYVGADSLAYLSPEGLLHSVGDTLGDSQKHCTACFRGDYAVPLRRPAAKRQLRLIEV